MEVTAEERRKRKEEGKRLKQLRIAEAGGKRPRKEQESPRDKPNTTSTQKVRPAVSKKQKTSVHRFGRVMESVPCRNKPRFSTVSIALPSSVLTNCQTKELRTQMVGQIARASTIYHVDEVVVFDDKLSRDGHGGGVDHSQEDPQQQPRHRSTPHEFMARLLEYCECPQYLRRQFFPMHPDLQFAGLLAPIDAPHHVRVHEESKYREGVVLEQVGPNNNSLVNCGVRGRPVEIDRKLKPGIRCTVKIDTTSYRGNGKLIGEVVSPAAPREEDGSYWGYTTRLAPSLKAALEDCPFGKYDLKIGTSERGDTSMESGKFSLPRYQHAIIVFGGVAGIEECVDADESFKIPGSQSSKLFDMWLNVCPYQGSRTIRTEEAVLISLAKLSSYLRTSEKEPVPEEEESSSEAEQKLEFSDNSPSEESSDSEEEE